MNQPGAEKANRKKSTPISPRLLHTRPITPARRTIGNGNSTFSHAWIIDTRVLPDSQRAAPQDSNPAPARQPNRSHDVPHRDPDCATSIIH